MVKLKARSPYARRRKRMGADSYGEYQGGKLIRSERINGTIISEQLPGMMRKLRMDGSVVLGEEW